MKPLKIIVCIKQVPDPESPASCFEVDSKRVIAKGIPPVINPFDENALEAALHLKEENGATIIAVSLGEKLAKQVLARVLAAGADELILLDDPLFRDLTSYSTASVLSAMIKKIGDYDLILTGRQGGDWDFGTTGLLIGQMLRIPSINLAQKIMVKDDRFLVERLSPNGYELVSAPMPALATVTSEIGELRYISIRAIRAASKQPMRIYSGVDLDLDPQRLQNRRIVALSPYRIHRECKIIEGSSPQEKGRNLAVRLTGEGVIHR